MKRKTGKVILVGAGPGDPGLLTLKGERMLRRADVIVYDSLVNPQLLNLAGAARLLFVGKKGRKSWDQAAIHRVLLRSARAGKFVVRLKGGDPFIFGRGGEEATFLSRHRIPFEVVPGVSAGIGVPAYAGIPLTDRRFASQVVFVTGHGDPKKDSLAVDWKSLGAIGRGTPRRAPTLVSFMGVANLPRILKELREGGRSPRTPVAVIEWGTLPNQRVVAGTLKDIHEKAQKAGIRSPALTVIGEVVRLRKKLAWFEREPLRGKTVLVTRAREQASELVEALRDRGAEVLEFPTIQILPPRRPERMDREIRRLTDFDWIVFTSANGVRFFFDGLTRMGKDARIFSKIKIAAIGEATASILREKGLRADLVPREFTSHALFQSLKEAGEIRGKKILLARADIAPPDLRESLKREGAAQVIEIEAYRTRPASAVSKALLHRLRKGEIDYVTFTSSSTVKNFFDELPPPLRKRIPTRFVTIGPVTTETLQAYGHRPSKEARIHTLEGLIETISNGGSR